MIVAEKRLDDGRLVLLQLMLVNWRVSLQDDPLSLSQNYCYPGEARERAVEGFLAWEGEGDPPDGWIKHVETGRRRPDGTPASEHVYW